MKPTLRLDPAHLLQWSDRQGLPITSTDFGVVRQGHAAGDDGWAGGAEWRL